MTQQQESGTVRVQPAKKRGGEWVDIGEEAYRIPPLGFLQVQELADDVEQLKDIAGGRPTPGQMDTVVKIVHAAMSRNYPDLPVDEVRDMLDLGNYARILSAALAIAGFKEAAGGAGEAPASTGPQPTAP